jgi:hypothetical protein
MERIARENRPDAEHGGAGMFSFPRGFGLDGLDQLRDTRSIDFRRQMGPTGYGRKGYGLDRGIAQRANVLVAKAGGEFQGAVEPVTHERRTLNQRSRAVDARPLADALHQVFLHRLAEDVSQALDLGGVLVGDDGHLIPPVEDGTSPASQAVDLPGELGLGIAHEIGGLARRVDDQEQVKM